VSVAYKPDGGSPVPRSVYTYNALNWRIMKQADLDYISETNPLDQERKMYYSADWQVLEERIDEDYIANPGVNRRMQYIWGPRYIDDIVLRRLDGTADGDFTDGADKVYYHCTDVQFSTVAVVSNTAILLERVSYDPYGRARHHRPADMTGEGAVDTPDLNVVSANYGSVPAPGDVDRDGDVDVDDYIAVTLGWGAGIASGQLSLTDNVIGWDGYVLNAELDEDGMYTVRFRHYRPGLGRWLERDPLQYIDGLNLYHGLRDGPMLHNDPGGTACTSTSCSGAASPITPPVVWPVGPPNDPFPPSDLGGIWRPLTSVWTCCRKACTGADIAVASCCKGKRIICVCMGVPYPFSTDDPWQAIGGAFGNQITHECTLAHELEHHTGQPWTSCAGVPDGGRPVGKSLDDFFRDVCTHCDIYRAEEKCLIAQMSKCDALSNAVAAGACKAAVREALRGLKTLMDRYCDPKDLDPLEFEEN
jgi:RHS repeat-associated protein